MAEKTLLVSKSMYEAMFCFFCFNKIVYALIENPHRISLELCFCKHCRAFQGIALQDLCKRNPSPFLGLSTIMIKLKSCLGKHCNYLSTFVSFLSCFLWLNILKKSFKEGEGVSSYSVEDSWSLPPENAVEQHEL